MTKLSNSEQIEQICNLPGIDIEEGGHGLNYQQIQFTFKDKGQFSNGNFELTGDTLNFYVCYQIDGQDFDIEHEMVNAEESVIFGNIGSYAGTVCYKDGAVNTINIQAKNGKSWTFSAKKGLRFMTLDEQ